VLIGRFYAFSAVVVAQCPLFSLLFLNFSPDDQMNKILSLLGVVLLSGGVGGAAAQGVPRIAADVVAVSGSNVTFKATTGEAMTVKLADSLRVLVVSQILPAAIKPGFYLAVTADLQADGSLVATRVNVFPESMRGVGDGHRPMPATGNTMTNATVASVMDDPVPSRNTMTNATVAKVMDASGARSVMLKYKDGEKRATIPANLPVTLIEQVDRSLIVPGAHALVAIVKAADGSLSTGSVSLGKNGSVPKPY
jgi:hypothetical protein